MLTVRLMGAPGHVVKSTYEAISAQVLGLGEVSTVRRRFLSIRNRGQVAC